MHVCPRSQYGQRYLGSFIVQPLPTLDFHWVVSYCLLLGFYHLLEMDVL